MEKKMYRVSLDVYVEAASKEQARELGIEDLKYELDDRKGTNVEVEDASYMSHSK